MRTKENNYYLDGRWQISHQWWDGKWSASFRAGDNCYGVVQDKNTLEEVLAELEPLRAYYEAKRDDPDPRCTFW